PTPLSLSQEGRGEAGFFPEVPEIQQNHLYPLALRPVHVRLVHSLAVPARAPDRLVQKIKQELLRFLLIAVLRAHVVETVVVVVPGPDDRDAASKLRVPTAAFETIVDLLPS